MDGRRRRVTVTPGRLRELARLANLTSSGADRRVAPRAVPPIAEGPSLLSQTVVSVQAVPARGRREEPPTRSNACRLPSPEFT